MFTPAGGPTTGMRRHVICCTQKLRGCVLALYGLVETRGVNRREAEIFQYALETLLELGVERHRRMIELRLHSLDQRHERLDVGFELSARRALCKPPKETREGRI